MLEDSIKTLQEVNKLVDSQQHVDALSAEHCLLSKEFKRNGESAWGGRNPVLSVDISRNFFFLVAPRKSGATRAEAGNEWLLQFLRG
jgi:hypothetical protein